MSEAFQNYLVAHEQKENRTAPIWVGDLLWSLHTHSHHCIELFPCLIICALSLCLAHLCVLGHLPAGSLGSGFCKRRQWRCLSHKVAGTIK